MRIKNKRATLYHFNILIHKIREGFISLLFFIMKRFRVENNGDVLDNNTGEFITNSKVVIPDDGSVDLFNQYKDITNLRYIANQLDMTVPEVKKLLKR